MTIQRAWAPGNISLLFKVMPNPDPAKAGSLGSGFTVNEGATVTVKKARTTCVSFNEQPVVIPTVGEVISRLTKQPLSISIETPLPLGSGFGISGASALATAHAVNALLALHKSDVELAQIAHTAEVVHKTGLGDVGNQWKGGCCVKFITSSLFQMERLPFSGTVVYVHSWGKIPTPSILGSTKLIKRIDAAGDHALKALETNMRKADFAFRDLLETGNGFTRESGLLSFAPHAERVIESVKKQGGNASMIILGDAVVSTLPFAGSIKLTIIEHGVKLL